MERSAIRGADLAMTTPDFAEPVIGRAFARPGGSIRATRFSKGDNYFVTFTERFRPRNHPIFPHIEITRLSPANVSSPTLRRNNSFAHETIFPLSCRHPETLVN